MFGIASFRTCFGQLSHLQGWRRALWAMALGILATLALPPLHFFFLLFIAFPGFFLLLRTASSSRRAWMDGFWFGLGHFISGFYWIAYSLLVDPERYAWLLPFAVIGLNAIIALYPAFFALVFYRLNSRLSYAGNMALPLSILLFCLLWLGQEWLRGHLFTGFPWNLIAYAWTASDSAIQIFWWLGTYGVSFFTVLLALSPLLLGTQTPSHHLMGLCLLALLPVALVAGAARLSDAHVIPVKDVRLRIVQANIPQGEKWQPGKRWAAFRAYLAHSRRDGHDNVTHIIWPETAMTFMFQEGDRWARQLAGVVPKGGALFTGVVRMEGSFAEGSAKLFNSLQAVDEQARIRLTYDKIKLVPFGEFVPFRHWLPLTKITAGTLDFSAGTTHSSYHYPGLPAFRPLICYEAIFPGFGHDDKPEWFLGITNDAWFGDSPGPYQHLAMSRVRAVEEGIPFIRAANTGISAAIDPYGRIMKQIGLGKAGIIDTVLPVPVPR